MMKLEGWGKESELLESDELYFFFLSKLVYGSNTYKVWGFFLTKTVKRTQEAK